jgi:fluoroacetyl-CoA thioesterase
MLDVGATHEQSWTVGREHLASAFGSGLVDVLATPVLVGFCEECARTMVDPHLAAGQKTVGTQIRLQHLAATPPGLRVAVRATLVEIEGRRLRFAIDAEDDIEPIARATHERFIIDAARFEVRLAEKAKRARTEASR